MSIKKERKMIHKTGELMWLLGVVFVSLGVAICSKADLGVSMIAAPPFIIWEALAPHVPWLTVGVTEYIFQGLLLGVLCIAVQRFNRRYLPAFLVAVAYGYTLDLWLLIMGTEPFAELWMRWVMLIVGDAITALGVACFFRTYMPLQVYELFVAEVADRYKFKVNKTKLVYDMCSLGVSVILAFSLFGDVKSFDWSMIYSEAFHYIGLGTIVTTVINSALIALWGKILDCCCTYEPLLPKFKKLITAPKRGK